MKKSMRTKLLFTATLGLAAAFLAAGCNAGPEFYRGPHFESAFDDAAENAPNFRYDSIIEQTFRNAGEEPSSYFSLDRNTAGYSQVRAQIKSGQKIAYDSVRTEELVNYFSYDFPAPEAGETVRATTYLSDCPWNGESKLVTVGIRTEELVLTASRNNYVFLIDVSGSMSANVMGEDMTCLDLVKYGIETLVGGLNENDCVSIVTYASGVGVRLEPTRADGQGKEEILSAVRSLDANGSTYGSGGIRLAYDCAERYFAKDGNNRVILMTDGDFNVGVYDKEELETLISEEATSGVYLSVIGVGMGNMRDDLMQTLALRGNGNYAYIDTPKEAEKVLKEELGGMLVTVARDAKAGVTFDPDAVSRYRILGYDMKTMSQSDFDNSEKDAGEIGSNLTVVALYEVELKEGANDAIADVAVRFKDTAGIDREVKEEVRLAPETSDELTFISCVAEFGLVLRQSQFKGDASLESVLGRLGGLKTYLAEDPYKAEFKDLVERAMKSHFYD